jgi:hypothetical protein
VRNCNVLVGKYIGKRPIRRYKYRLEDNIKMYLEGIRYQDVDLIPLDYDRAQ